MLNIGRCRRQQDEILNISSIKTNYVYVITEVYLDRDKILVPVDFCLYHYIYHESIRMEQISKTDHIMPIFKVNDIIFHANYWSHNEEITNKLEEFDSSINNNTKKIIIGDFNVRKLENFLVKYNERGREERKNFILANNFIVKNTYNIPTLINHNGSSLMDLFWVCDNWADKVSSMRLKNNILTQHRRVLFRMYYAQSPQNSKVKK